MRQSNIELLRIVSMFFIVLEHILIMGTAFFSDAIGMHLPVANAIIGFTYIGVNCFILITGYFGAELSWKRLLSLYLICCFYEVIGFIVAYAHGNVEWSTTALSFMLFPLSHSNTWFIRCYVILLLMLPILNAGLNRLDKRQYLYALLAVTVLNLYFGWFHKQPNFSSDGYSASQMVYLYVIGRYIHRFVEIDKLRARKGWILIVWFLLAIAWGVIQNGSILWYAIPHWNGWAYNNPVVLAASIAFFLFFACLRCKPSKLINLIGGTMFGVLLIHMNRYLCSYLYNVVWRVIYHPSIAGSEWLQYAVLVALAIGLVILLSLLDMPRMMIHHRIFSKLTSLKFIQAHDKI